MSAQQELTSMTSRNDASQEQGRRQAMKQKWKELKQEDERRRESRFQTTSAEEAGRITGLDRHREEEARKSAARKRGSKGFLGVVFMS